MKSRYTLSIKGLIIFIILFGSSPVIAQDYILPVDPTSDLISLMTTQGTGADINKWAFFNKNDNALVVYDLTSRTIDKRLRSEKEGPNRLVNMYIYGAMSWVNSDTIVFFDTQVNRYYLSNMQGQIYKRGSIEGGTSGFGSLTPIKSMAYRKGRIYMQSWPVRIGPDMAENPDEVPNKIVEINLSDNTHNEVVLDFPEIYKRADYGQDLKDIDIFYHKQIEKFIINFPLSSSLYVTDLKGNTKAYSSQSDLVKKAVGMETLEDKTDENTWSDMSRWLSDHYEDMIYDEQSGYTIRIARKGISERAYLNRDFETKREALVFDQDFKLVQSFELNNNILYWFFKDGYFYYNKSITKYNFETGNENELFFTRIKLN